MSKNSKRKETLPKTFDEFFILIQYIVIQYSVLYYAIRTFLAMISYTTLITFIKFILIALNTSSSRTDQHSCYSHYIYKSQLGILNSDISNTLDMLKWFQSLKHLSYPLYQILGYLDFFFRSQVQNNELWLYFKNHLNNKIGNFCLPIHCITAMSE